MPVRSHLSRCTGSSILINGSPIDHQCSHLSPVCQNRFATQIWRLGSSCIKFGWIRSRSHRSFARHGPVNDPDPNGSACAFLPSLPYCLALGIARPETPLMVTSSDFRSQNAATEGRWRFYFAHLVRFDQIKHVPQAQYSVTSAHGTSHTKKMFDGFGRAEAYVDRASFPGVLDETEFKCTEPQGVRTLSIVLLHAASTVSSVSTEHFWNLLNVTSSAFECYLPLPLGPFVQDWTVNTVRYL